MHFRIDMKRFCTNRRYAVNITRVHYDKKDLDVYVHKNKSTFPYSSFTTRQLSKNVKREGNQTLYFYSIMRWKGIRLISITLKWQILRLNIAQLRLHLLSRWNKILECPAHFIVSRIIYFFIYYLLQRKIYIHNWNNNLLHLIIFVE